MSPLRRSALISAIIILFFAAEELQVRNDFFLLGAQSFSRISKKIYYTAAAIIPKEKPVVLLDIRFHAQEHSLSCEIASLKMILDYRGLDVSESDLLKKLPFSDRGPRKLNVWGDPDIGFVGNIDGSMPKNTGYGVYEKPLSNLAGLWRKAEVISNKPLERIVGELDRGNPIIVWGALGGGKDNSWYTPEGKYIKAVKGAHVRVLKGYTGTSKNPSEVILMDPIYGEIRWPVKKFLANWAMLENRAVVVY